MSLEAVLTNYAEQRRRKWRIAFALTLGALIATVTWNLGASGRPGVIAAVPGLVVSMAVAGNVHAFSLEVAAVVNFILYYAIGRWLARLIYRRPEGARSKTGS